MHRNINQDSDSGRLSNISRLFRAHEVRETMDLDSSYLYSKIYIPGLGTDFEDQTAERLHSIMDSQQKALLDNTLDSASGQTKEAVVDTLFEANKKNWFDTLSNHLDELFSIKGAKKGAKAVITDTAQNIAKKVTLEALPALRDNPTVMEQFMTGVDARVDGAKRSFKDRFEFVKSRNQLPIKLIQISVFGADLGGILARRFIDELLEGICTKQGEDYIYDGAKVQVIFAGLFDCTRRSSLDSGDTMNDVFSFAGILLKPLEWIGGGKVIDFDKPLHRAVKKALHLVAAHERRVYRPLVPLGPLKSGWDESLLPGISEDITGGLLPNEQRPSAELSRVALHQMYHAARSGEVPFPNFNELHKVSEKVAAYFVMHDNLAGKSVQYYTRQYMQQAGNKKLSRQAFENHQYIYSWWLGKQYADYKARLKDADSGERSWLRKRWGWLEFVYDEAKYVERAVTNPNGYVAYVQGSNALNMAKTFLYPPSREFPKDIATFFTYFMHDFVSSTAFTSSPSEHVKIKAQAKSVVGSHHFFLARKIESVEG
ncbi:hypothetical protein C1E47_17315 [Vibrio cholerae]|nr:hypothetical protein [Vibrio cholerae]